MLPMFLMLYRATATRTTKYSPAELFIGRRLHLPQCITAPHLSHEPKTEMMRRRMKQLRTIHNVARRTYNRHHEQMRAKQHCNPRLPALNLGDRVLVKSHYLGPDESRKYHRFWEGPFEICEKVNAAVYRYCDDEGNVSKCACRKNLRLWVGRELDSSGDEHVQERRERSGSDSNVGI